MSSQVVGGLYRLDPLSHAPISFFEGNIPSERISLGFASDGNCSKDREQPNHARGDQGNDVISVTAVHLPTLTVGHRRGWVDENTAQKVLEVVVTLGQ